MRPAPRGERGFTLVELLVALAVLGLLLTLLGGAMGIGTGWMAVGRQHVDDMRRVAGAQALLRRALEQIVPLAGPAAGEQRTILFTGTADRLAFVGRLPEHAAIPGLAWLELEREGGDRPGPVVLRWRPLAPAGGRKIPYGPSGSLPLLGAVGDLRFRYLREVDARAVPIWVDAWTDAPALPLAIAVDVSAPGDSGWRWPTLVVRPVLD